MYMCQRFGEYEQGFIQALIDLCLPEFKNQSQIKFWNSIL